MEAIRTPVRFGEGGKQGVNRGAEDDRENEFELKISIDSVL